MRRMQVGIPSPGRTTKWLLIVIAGAMLAQVVLGGLFLPQADVWHEVVSKRFGIYLPHLMEGMVWQPITAILLHSTDGWGHLLMNLVVLFFFGSMLEPHIGSRRMLGLFIFAGLLSSLFVILADVVRMLAGFPLVPTLGASGAISGVVGGVCMIYWHRHLHFFFFQAKGWHLLVAILVIDLLRVVGGAPISMVGHVGGLLAGLWWMSRMSPRILWLKGRLWWTRRKLKVVPGGKRNGAHTDSH